MAQILRMPAVLARIGVSRSTLYQWVSEGRFPPSVPLGARARGWLDSDVTAWIDARAREARGTRGEAESDRRHEAMDIKRSPGGAADAPSRANGLSRAATTVILSFPESRCRSCRIRVPWRRGLCRRCAAWLRARGGILAAAAALREAGR